TAKTGGPIGSTNKINILANDNHSMSNNCPINICAQVCTPAENRHVDPRSAGVPCRLRRFKFRGRVNARAFRRSRTWAQLRGDATHPTATCHTHSCSKKTARHSALAYTIGQGVDYYFDLEPTARCS